MNAHNVINMIVSSIEKNGYNGSFGIFRILDCISISMVMHEHSVGRIVQIQDVALCSSPNHMIDRTIKDMMNQLIGGNDND